MPRSKKQCQVIHAKKRALQRYETTLSTKDIKEIVKQIQDRNGKFLLKKSNRITIWLVEYNGQKYKVAYDKTRKSIATFLPFESSDNNFDGE